MNYTVLFTLILFVAGCASTSEILTVNENTYQVSSEMGGQFPSWSDVKGLALKKANAFCAQKELYTLHTKVVKWETHGARGWTLLNAELTFMCLKPSS